MVYPEYAEIDGKQYKLNTDFKVALKCFEVIEDDLICDEERSLAIIYLLWAYYFLTSVGYFYAQK